MVTTEKAYHAGKNVYANYYVNETLLRVTKRNKSNNKAKEKIIYVYV